MFKKLLIANRGEIAVRIIRTCRELGIGTVALYDPTDRASLHVRLADECVPVADHHSFMDAALIIDLALACGADAIHPGYGFLAEDASFIRACDAAGITFIGPPAGVVERLRDKIAALQTAAAAGIRTVAHSPVSFGEDENDALADTAEFIGYPLVIKSCRGGRGRGERLVTGPATLAESIRRSRIEAQRVYGDGRLFLERAILPAHQIGVQIVADAQGHRIHLGEREGSIIHSNQKIVEEAPALCLSAAQREEMLQTALDLARLFQYENLGTVEFLVDGDGTFYFSEFKARIQIEHTLTEMLTGLDLVQLQLLMAAGEPLPLAQAAVRLDGWALMCRVRAEDPTNNFLPSPGRLRRVRLPGGPDVRVDTYVYCHCDVPPDYDPLVAKVTVWAPERPRAVERMRRALEDFTIIGPPTNLPLLTRVMGHASFVGGDYTTDFLDQPLTGRAQATDDRMRRDLALAAAVAMVRRREAFSPQTPERLATGWHRASRRLRAMRCDDSDLTGLPKTCQV